MTKSRPRIGVSRCLLGDAVRYDGDSRPSSAVDELGDGFELVPVCPEVEAGLGIPRPPVQLTGEIDQPRMTGRDDVTIDVTDVISEYCHNKLDELAALQGFIFKSRSPSCGYQTTPVFIDGECITASADGIFVRHFRQRYPDIPIIDELTIEDAHSRQAFIDAVMRLAT